MRTLRARYHSDYDEDIIFNKNYWRLVTRSSTDAYALSQLMSYRQGYQVIGGNHLFDNNHYFKNVYRIAFEITNIRLLKLVIPELKEVK